MMPLCLFSQVQGTSPIATALCAMLLPAWLLPWVQMHRPQALPCVSLCKVLQGMSVWMYPTWHAPATQHTEAPLRMQIASAHVLRFCTSLSIAQAVPVDLQQLSCIDHCWASGLLCSACLTDGPSLRHSSLPCRCAELALPLCLQSLKHFCPTCAEVLQETSGDLAPAAVLSITDLIASICSALQRVLTTRSLFCRCAEIL